MINVEQWAESCRLHRIDKMSIRGIAQHIGVVRNSVWSALRSFKPPNRRRKSRLFKLDLYKDCITEILDEFPRLLAARAHEVLTTEEGFDGGFTVLWDHVREVRTQPIEAC